MNVNVHEIKRYRNIFISEHFQCCKSYKKSVVYKSITIMQMFIFNGKFWFWWSNLPRWWLCHFKEAAQSEGKLLNLFQSEASASPRIQLWISFIVEILLMLLRASLSRKSFAGIWQQFLSPTSACYQTSILTRLYPSPAFERSRFHSH